MAIIYSYPLMTDTISGDDLLLMTDVSDSKKTKSVKVSALPSSGAGITLTTTGTSGPATLIGTVLNVPNYNTSAGGDTYTLQAETKSSNSIPLKLDAATGSDSTVNLTEGANVTLTRNSATEITIAATGGAAGVSSFTNSNGTYISAGTANSAATGAVTMGTIDLSAVDGTSDTTTRFLSKDNTWDVPSYTAAYSLPLANSSTRGGVKIVSSRDVSPLQSPSTDANRDYQVQINTNASHAEQLFVNVPWTDTSGISFSGSTANGIATYSSATTANVSANLTFATNTLTLTDTLDIKGDGTNPGTLNLYCENTSVPHAVSILGPVHTGATPYSIRLPKDIATQTAYSSGGRILESDASGALQWINTPSAGVSPTSGTWYATLANASGQSYASNATQAQISITTNDCQWYRVGDMMYYQFYIAGTVKAGGSLTGNLFLCRSASSIATATTTYGLPIDSTYNTVVDNGFCNGSVTITESEAPAQPLTWTYPINGGRVGRDTNYVGYVQLFSLFGSGSTNKVYYPLSNQTWVTGGEAAGNFALGGTINALVTHQ